MQDAIQYLIELRRRLLRCVLVIGVVFVIFLFFANHIYQLFTLPLLKYIPEHQGLIATSVPAPFLVPMKSALIVAIYITVPYWLYELWAFIAPAMYRQERKLGWVFLFGGTALFYLGTLFAYFAVTPLVLNFFIKTAPAAVEVKPDISLYFGFVMRLLFAFGFAFLLPLAILLLIAAGVTTRERLKRKRPYVIVVAFVVGMLLTPPDIISQIMLAVPIWVLFEVGMLLAKYLLPSLQNKTLLK